MHSRESLCLLFYRHPDIGDCIKINLITEIWFNGQVAYEL